MQLSQLEAVRAIARNGYNMSVAAGMLRRSQSALSRQIKELEQELGFRIFTRTRNNISGITSQGEEVLRIGQRILSDAEDLHQLASWASPDCRGELKIGTTHIHARYTLPAVVKNFSQRFPQVLVAIQELDPIACCKAVVQGEVDIGITSVPAALADRVATIPAFRLAPGLFVPHGHPLTREDNITLERLARFPFISHPRTYAVRALLDKAFADAGLHLQVICTATDADACKKYVEADMGIAVLAQVVFDPLHDTRIAVLNVDHIFPPATTCIVLRKQAYLSRSLHALIAAWAPHVSQPMIRKALSGDRPPDVRQLAGLPILGQAAEPPPPAQPVEPTLPSPSGAPAAAGGLGLAGPARRLRPEPLGERRQQG